VEIRGYFAEGDSDDVVIEVIDNGIGVAPGSRTNLFQRFYRANEESAEGIGLGLTIVKEAIESFGGTAWADFDRPGVTVFGLTLPSRRGIDKDDLDLSGAGGAG
jgi:signal transduction histidine kinase